MLKISIILSLGFIIFLFYYNSANIIPIFELFRGTDLALNRLRSDVQGFEGRRYIYQIYFRDVLPFISFYLFALIIRQKSKKIILLFLITFLFTSLINLMNFQKGPIGFYVLGLFMVYFVIQDKNISLKNMVVLSMIVIPLFMALYITFMGRDIDKSLVLTPFRRILTGQNASAFFHLKMFPEHEQYLYGRSFPNPMGILPFKNYELSKNVQDFMKPTLREKGIHGSAPAVYWAGMYANFGVIGALFSSFLLGAIIYIIHLMLSKGPLNPLTAALITWMSLHLALVTITSINRVIIDPNLIGVLISYFFCKCKFKLFHNKQLVFKRS
jgi:oligosaccharide repeat unit polymerase